jgi:hypothetical protein
MRWGEGFPSVDCVGFRSPGVDVSLVFCNEMAKQRRLRPNGFGWTLRRSGGEDQQYSVLLELLARRKL